MSTKYAIIGAGIGGLAAGAALKAAGEEDFLIFEKADSLPLTLGNGVHYLHEEVYTPFDFRFNKIRSTEQIWDPHKDEFRATALLPDMLAYSMKVMGRRHPSSVMYPGTRNWGTYLPEDNNMNSLLRAYAAYIGEDHFMFKHGLVSIQDSHALSGSPTGLLFESQRPAQVTNIISTMPLPRLIGAIDRMSVDCPSYSRPIYITNYRAINIVDNWLISIYIPNPDFPAYRVTCINGIISLESSAMLTERDEHVINYHLGRYFEYNLGSKEIFCWTQGRIWGLSVAERLPFVERLVNRKIYPLGRFGLWDGKLQMHSTIRQAHSIVQYLIAQGNTWIEDVDMSEQELISYLSESKDLNYGNSSSNSHS